MIRPRPIELLAPAANSDIAIEAILHGADAVYIGPPSHGARKAASNSLKEIKRVVDFAHPYGVKVYATVNTIVYDNEAESVASLISDLYKIGVDAIIVQDMGILRMDIPPIALHASTQCDTRTPEKALFLEKIGFSQIVLARELTLEEIKSITDTVSVPVECFVHGALCVSFSGRCHASQEIFGRSANRGECAQICRWAYNLVDADGRSLAKNRHLLSLKDLNLSDRIEELLKAGVSSFKIEGRLKDASYVKNIVALYRQKIDSIISRYPDLYTRSSSGQSEIEFTPKADKSFNRGFTNYFIDNKRPSDIASLLTPKSMGEEIKDVRNLRNGDGISFFNPRMEYEGVMVNGIKGNKIIGNREFVLPKNSVIHRTFDIEWQKKLTKPTATRRLRLEIELSDTHLSARDERGVCVTLPLPENLEEAKKRVNLRPHFDKFGNTIFKLVDFNYEQFTKFIPPSVLSDLRRRLVETLMQCSKATYPYEYRKQESYDALYPWKKLDFRDNVANNLAAQFYRDHGVDEIQPAIEIDEKGINGPKVVMTTRHCILRELGMCLKDKKRNQKQNFRLPLSLESGKNKFNLRFDCLNCRMEVLH